MERPESPDKAAVPLPFTESDIFRYVGDDDSPAEPLPDRDFSQFFGYWHGFTFVIFDEQNPEAWIRSTYWVEVAGEGSDRVDPEDR